MPTTAEVSTFNTSARDASLVHTGALGETQPRTNASPQLCDALPDDKLLALIAERDKHAMQALYCRYNIRLYRFVARIAAATTLAEDIVSETFVDVWKAAKSYKAQSTVATWLYSIARNKAYSALRRSSDRLTNDGLNEEIEDTADTPEGAILKLDRSKLLQRCLVRLSPMHREVVDLVYYHEKPIHEVAEILSVAENTVKTRLHYARAHIERLLKEMGVTTLH